MDLPPAPTPPVGPMASNSERTANLLNLLKFSGGGGGGSNSSQQSQSSREPKQQQQSQQGQSQSQQSQMQLQHFPQHPAQQHSLALTHQPGLEFPTRIHQPAPTSADPTGLLAALMRGAHESDEPKAAPLPPAVQQAQLQSPPPANPFGNGSPPADTRSYLLNLLNRPKPSQGDEQQQHQQQQHQQQQPPLLTETSRPDNLTPQSADHSTEGNRYYGQYHQAQANPYQSMNQYHSDSFTEVSRPAHSTADSFSFPPSQDQSADMSALYQQLMGSLAQSSPQSQTHNQNHNGQSPNTAAFQILKKGQDSPAGSQHSGQARMSMERSPITSPPQHFRRNVDRASSLHSHHSASKQTPPTSEFDSYVGSAEKNRETVAAAVGDIADKADEDAREAIERVEQDQNRAEIAEDLHDMLHAKSEHEFDESAQAAAKALQKELDREGNQHVLEDALPAEVAEAAHDIVDEAAQGVADSWENTDQDEIVVIEEKETPPVRVYNFPMKPWISISMQEETTEPRPQFRDETIMDIARLKKDFDQIDRNLYTATENYMTYGMSKQGGLRVIRQEDGKDAKIFTDTKDRIFNVGMSVTPSDHEGASREAIIGTGISGTVYWVQIRYGEKDHIEDAHLEQYGFALPPMSSQEGDTPGGVLKTRARTSTNHPEYFAVGRGKCINLIWPSYIMQNNLFKPGHDRVVDAEKLAKQCSLKINTGKAGKDFTFSQDDSVIVSLDKSGRVKFWDVRDLTAVKEDSDPHAPMPAQTSLEVKDPLMTLASTPEGEKAWPTSVLLLDKQRPYQKRCALRYMIVGMKQNHTLQLWDLALGKPVQEFNLPHSKESDAVCSVMYHSATGMIVIGHPTRNSIYFAHLSAPKYNLRNLSQAEYIQRLVAQDPTIPQPDSTAVISGVREYSFANRGDLRSLDILANPAMVQDVDEPTLFELYAMHSKGVACLLIKQVELGWSKDNKVLDAVDAVAEGVVTISKLKPPQPQEPTPSTEPTQVRIVNRGQSKESLLQTTPSQIETPLRGPESVTPVKVKHETKEVETPVQPAKDAQSEKPERKTRKKKAAAAAAAAANQSDQGSTSTSTPRGQSNKAESKVSGVTANGNISPEALGPTIAAMESRLNASMAESLKGSLEDLHTKIDEGVRVRDDNFNQHQLKLLDMVSEVLNENTQKVLEALVHHQFTDLVIPAIGEKASKAVSDLFNNKLQPHVSSSIQKEIQSSLPHALNRALRSGDFINSISDRVGASVATSVQKEVLSTLTQRLTPTFNNIAASAAQRAAGEVHQQYQEQFEHMKAQHASDSNKIDQLLSYVGRLSEMTSTMAASQSALQAEFLKFKQQPVHELPGASGVPTHQHNGSVHTLVGGQGYGNPTMQSQHPGSHQGSFPPSQAPSHTQTSYMGSPQYVRGHAAITSPHASAPVSEQVGPANSVGALAAAYANQMNQSDDELDHDLIQRIRLIEQAIQEGRLQDAMIQWIQSGREEQIFIRCLSRYPASKFENLPPLMLLVVIATISKDLKPNPRVKEEVEWIEMAVRAFAANLPSYEWEKQGFHEVMKSTSQTMQLLISRVQPLLSGIQDGFPTDPFLATLDKQKLQWVIHTSEQVMDSFGGARRWE